MVVRLHLERSELAPGPLDPVAQAGLGPVGPLLVQPLEQRAFGERDRPTQMLPSLETTTVAPRPLTPRTPTGRRAIP